jgi:hypothetical protein
MSSSHRPPRESSGSSTAAGAVATVPATAMSPLSCRATFLADLLTPADEVEHARTAELRFDIDIDLLAAATATMVDWLGDYQRTAGLDVGLFGASTGPWPRW